MTKALNSALYSLTRREHSAWELQKKLEQKGYSELESLHALKECQRLGYQSDERFTEQFCRMRVMQGYGPVRIKQDLLAKGISTEMIQKVLGQETENYWLDRAVAVSRKKCQQWLHLSWDEQQKLKRFLLYRGFPPAIIAAIFEKSE